MNNNFELNDFLYKINNDTYLSELVEDYDKNKRKEKFIDICKVLSYRTLYLGIVLNIPDEKLLEKIEKENFIPEEELNDKSLFEKDLLKVISPSDENKYLLCVFTDPSKINFETMPVNGIEVNDMKYIWENYIASEDSDGIIINPENETIIIDKEFIEGIIKNDYSSIEMYMSLLERLNNMTEDDDIESILNEYFGFEENVEC